MQYGFTTLLKNRILNAEFYDYDKRLYVGLFVNENQPTDVPVELTIDEYDLTTGYHRAEIKFAEATAGSIVNETAAIFNKALEDWTSENVKVVAIGIFETATGDFTESCLAYLPLAEPEEVLAGQIFELNAAAVKLQLV